MNTMHTKNIKGIIAKNRKFEATFLNPKEKHLMIEYCKEMGYRLSFIAGVPVIHYNGRSGYIQRKNGKLIFANVMVRYNGSIIKEIEEDLDTNLKFFSIRKIIRKDTFWHMLEKGGFFTGAIKDKKLMRNFYQINFLEK